MKKTTSFIVLIISLVFLGLNTSCSKNNSSKYEQLIVGRWQFNNVPKQLNAPTYNVVWQFAPGGTIVIYEYDNAMYSGTYVINSNKLSLSFQYGKDDYIIVNLDQEYLELDYEKDNRRFLFQRLPN